MSDNDVHYMFCCKAALSSVQYRNVFNQKDNVDEVGKLILVYNILEALTIDLNSK